MATSDSWQRFERCRQHQPPHFSLYTLLSSLCGEAHKARQSRTSYCSSRFGGERGGFVSDLLGFLGIGFAADIEIRLTGIHFPGTYGRMLYEYDSALNCLLFIVACVKESQLHRKMSSFFLGSEAELENRFSELLPGRKLVIFYFCIMVVFLFVILNTEQFAPKMLLVVVAAACLIACILWMYPICNRRQGEALAVAGNDLRWHSEERVHVPPFATRAQLSDVRIQLALLDRDFDYRDYDALRALDDDITPAASTMGEKDANALPVRGNNSHHIVQVAVIKNCKQGTCSLCKVQ